MTIYDAEIRRVKAPKANDQSAAKRTHSKRSGDAGIPLPAGFSFLVSRNTAMAIEPAFEFLCYETLTREKRPSLVCSPASAKAWAEDLIDFHHYLDARGRTFELIDEELLQGYAYDLNNSISPVTFRKFAASTIRRRWSTLTKAIRFCQSRGYLKNRFAIVEVQTPQGTALNLDVGVKLPGLNEADEHVTALHIDTLNGVFDQLGPTPTHVEGGELIISDGLTGPRLMVELCRHAGLRRAEVCDLKAQTVLNAITNGKDNFVQVAIQVMGKGSKKRKVPVPVWLLNALKRYAVEERARLLGARTARRGMDHGFLFVQKTKSSRYKGEPVTPETLNRVFARARDEYLKKLASKDDVAYERASRERITVHALRHTFALHTYVARQIAGDPDPIKYIQLVLGHAMRQTTESIYLRSCEAHYSELESEILQRINASMK
jgi:integrase